MLHDPMKYPDPDSFRPERFLSEDGHFQEDPNIEAAYGFGRRSGSTLYTTTETRTNYEPELGSVLVVSLHSR